MSPDKQAQAAMMRQQLSTDAPEMLAFMESMKADFGAAVLFVETPNITAGKEPGPGIRPFIPLPDSTWPYAVGESPANTAKTAKRPRRRAR